MIVRHTTNLEPISLCKDREYRMNWHSISKGIARRLSLSIEEQERRASHSVWPDDRNFGPDRSNISVWERNHTRHCQRIFRRTKAWRRRRFVDWAPPFERRSSKARSDWNYLNLDANRPDKLELNANSFATINFSNLLELFFRVDFRRPTKNETENLKFDES